MARNDLRVKGVLELTTCASRTFGNGHKKLPESAFAYQQKLRSSYSLEAVVEYDEVKTLSADMKEVRGAYRSVQGVSELAMCASQTFVKGHKKLPESAFAYEQKPRSSYSLEAGVEYDEVKTLSSNMKELRSAYRRYEINS
jgi:hypothetical protein